MLKFPARLVGHPIAFTLLAVAVVVGTFTGVGYAATSRPAAAKQPAVQPNGSPPAAPLVWHQLKLMNGWQSAASWGTGPPSYAVSAQGVVYFAGSLHGGNQNAPAFVMPVGTRPGYYDCFSIFSNNSSNVQETGAFHIYATGKAYVQGPSVQFFSSLSGVSYVVGH
jgi:hypothetical protein